MFLCSLIEELCTKEKKKIKQVVTLILDMSVYTHTYVNNRSCMLQINNLNNRFEIIVLKFTTKKDIHEYTVSVFLLHFILYVATLYMFYDQFL